MKKQVAVLVDAGYLFAQAMDTLYGRPVVRSDIRLDELGMAAFLEAKAKEMHPERDLLRIYWYDAPPAQGAPPSNSQQRLAGIGPIKLRLGSLNGNGQQKGVDALICRDMEALARNGAVDRMMLIGGDEDLRLAVECAQSYGVRVHVVGIGTGHANIGLALACESDGVERISKEQISTLITLRNAPRPNPSLLAANGLPNSNVDKSTLANHQPAPSNRSNPTKSDRKPEHENKNNRHPHKKKRPDKKFAQPHNPSQEIREAREQQAQTPAQHSRDPVVEPIIIQSSESPAESIQNPIMIDKHPVLAPSDVLLVETEQLPAIGADAIELLSLPPVAEPTAPVVTLSEEASSEPEQLAAQASNLSPLTVLTDPEVSLVVSLVEPCTSTDALPDLLAPLAVEIPPIPSTSLIVEPVPDPLAADLSTSADPAQEPRPLEALLPSVALVKKTVTRRPKHPQQAAALPPTDEVGLPPATDTPPLSAESAPKLGGRKTKRVLATSQSTGPQRLGSDVPNADGVRSKNRKPLKSDPSTALSPSVKEIPPTPPTE